MHWSSPFASFYGNFPDVFSAKSRKDDRENLANRSWTFGEHSPVKIEKKCSSASKPATPTSLRIVPRKKVSTPLRIRQALQSDEEDEKFDYLAKRLSPADARSSIPDATLLPEIEVGDDALYHHILGTSSGPSNLCKPENFPRDTHTGLNLCDINKVVFPGHGMLLPPSLELHDLELQGSPDTLAVLDFVDAFSPEISPFKTFTTSKASLGFDIAEPDVYIPGVGWEECEDGSESEDDGEDEEDMILETDSEGTSSVFDSAVPAVSASSPAPSLPSSSQKGETEHDDMSEQKYDREDEGTDEDDMFLESDSTSISLVFDSPTPAVSASQARNRAVIPRLNPDAAPFIPRCVFILSAGPSPAAGVWVPPSVSNSHVDGINRAVKREGESTCSIIHSSFWPAETADADDIAFLRYFGLIDLALP